MNHPWEIYTLSDPRTLSVRYVGVSIDAQRRLMEHLKRAKRGTKTHCACWVRSLIAQSLTPILEVIERGVGKSRTTAEEQWIALYRSTCRLTNLTDGGEGAPGYRCSMETRAKLSAARLGKHLTPETRAKMGAAKMGHQVSPEARAKIRAARLGKHPTPETRAKMSTARKRRKCSLETRAKLSAAGRNRSPEWRAKISAANKRRYCRRHYDVLADET